MCGMISAIPVSPKHTFLLLLASFDLLKNFRPLYIFPIILLQDIQHFARLHPYLKFFFPSGAPPPHKLTQIKANERVGVVVPLLG